MFQSRPGLLSPPGLVCPQPHGGDVGAVLAKLIPPRQSIPVVSELVGSGGHIRLIVPIDQTCREAKPSNAATLLGAVLPHCSYPPLGLRAAYRVPGITSVVGNCGHIRLIVPFAGRRAFHGILVVNEHRLRFRRSLQ